MKHPMQNVAIFEGGPPRFVGNPIVQFLLDAGPFDSNQLSMMPFSDEDREQFAQLLGYSITGFGELPYVSEDSYERACQKVKEASEEWILRKLSGEDAPVGIPGSEK